MYPVALDAALGILLLIAGDTDRLLVTWYERLHADWLTTNFAAEAFLMKLLSFKLILLHSFNSYMKFVFRNFYLSFQFCSKNSMSTL